MLMILFALLIKKSKRAFLLFFFTTTMIFVISDVIILEYDTAFLRLSGVRFSDQHLIFDDYFYGQ